MKIFFRPQSITVWGAISFFVFIILTILVPGSFFYNMDIKTTLALQSVIPRIFDLPFSVFSFIGSFEVSAVVLFFIFFYLMGSKKSIGFLILVFFVFGHIIEIFGKLFLFHPSPPIALYRGIGLVSPAIYIHTNYSYPSGHILRTIYITVLLIFLVSIRLVGLKKLLVYALLSFFLIFMIISRLYLGEHWFSDVLGGLMLGLSLGLFSAYFVIHDKNKLHNAGKN